MKKLALLLFVAGLFMIGFTNTNCTRKGGDITPISGDTQKTSTKIDSSGEHIHITVTQGGVTTTGALVAAGAEVYLFNNFTDYEAYSNNGNHSSKYIDSTTSQGDGTCTILVPAKNCTGRYFPSSAGSYAGTAYNYYCTAKWKDPSNKNKLNTGWYSIDGNCKDAALISVSINDGLNGAGLTVPIGVIYP